MILQIKRGKAKNLNRTVTEPIFLVGSSDDCDMVLGDRQFPPIHFYLLHRNDRTVIRSTASHPELTVNGHTQRTAKPLQPGDRIRTGPYEFVVKAA